jgi:hypothetical protein
VFVGVGSLWITLLSSWFWWQHQWGEDGYAVHEGRQGVNEQIKFWIQDCGYRWAKHVWIFYGNMAPYLYTFWTM